jgi:hypothetical protein
MSDTDTPILGQVKLEVAAMFQAQLLFVDNKGNRSAMAFMAPPGIYPGRWLQTLVEEAQREGIKALKLKTSDLSWRLPTPKEFCEITANGQIPNNLNLSWQPAFSVKLDIEDEAPKGVII